MKYKSNNYHQPKSSKDDIIFDALDQNKTYQNHCLYYIQLANTAIADAFCDFALKRVSHRKSQILVNNKITLCKVNNQSKSTRNINLQWLIELIKPAVEYKIDKLKNFAASIKKRQLDIVENKKIILTIKNTTDPQKLQLYEIINERFSMHKEFNFLWATEQLNYKRNKILHNNPYVDQIKFISAISPFLLPQFRSEFIQKQKKFINELQNIEPGLQQATCIKLDEELQKLKEINKRETYYLFSEKEKLQRYDARKKGQIELLKKLSEKRQSIFKKRQRLKLLKLQYLPTCDPQLKDYTLASFINFIGIGNFKKLSQLFTNQKMQPSFWDIYDIYFFSCKLNKILNKYLEMIKESLPENTVKRTANFGVFLKSQDKKIVTKNFDLFDEIVHLRNNIAHNKIIFFIPQKNKKNNTKYYTPASIVATFNNFLNLIKQQESASNMVNEIKTLCSNMKFVRAINDDGKIIKIKKWDIEQQLKFGNKNENRKINKRKNVYNIIKPIVTEINSF